MDKSVAVCLSLAIWLALLQYGINTTGLGESTVSYGVLDDTVRPYLIARMPLTGTRVDEWVAMTTPAHSKYVYIHRRWTYRKSRQRFPPSWVQTTLLRILPTVLHLQDRLMVLCIRVLLAVLRARIFLALLRMRAHRQAVRAYRVFYRCLQSVVHYPQVLVTMVTGYAASVVEMLLMRSGDVEPNPGPTGQLCPNDLVSVLTELLDVCANWYNFGLPLQLKPGTLNALKGPHKELKDCLRDMLEEWLNTSPNPSWEDLVKALRHRIVGQESLASELEQKYCTHIESEPVDHQAQARQTEVQIMPKQTVEPPPEPSQRGIKETIDELERSFHILIDRCFTVLEEKKVTGRRLASCLMSLSVRIQEHHEEFLEEDLAKVEECHGLMPVWRSLIKYCDFLNYELLQHVINTFGDVSLRTDMDKYVHEIKTFHKTTPLSKFVDNWPKRDIKPPEDKFRKLVIKMDLEWDKCTLEDIELIREAFTQKFFPKKSALLLKEIESGCVLITWYIPVDVAITLKKDLQNTRDQELFKEHRVEWLTVDGEKCFYSPLRQYANFLKDFYKNPPSSLTSAPPSDRPLHFSVAKIEKEQISKEQPDSFTQSTLRGDKDDIPRKKTPISFTDVGRLPDDSSLRLVLIEGAPGVGKTTFSWEYCRRWARGELLQMISLVLLLPLRDNRIRAAKSLSDLFYHSDPDLRKEIRQELKRSQGEGVVIWLEALDEFGQSLEDQPNSIFLDLILGKVLPKATIFITSRPHGSKFLLEQHEQRIAQHIEILGSAKEQIEAVARSDTPSSIGRRFLRYISENPMITAVMYTPVTCAMVLEVFNYNLAKNTNLPATMTQLYTAFTCMKLSDYLSHHPEYGTQQWRVHKFSDLPHKVYVQFRELCALAYEGIENNQQIVFSNLPPGFDSLGLMQEVHQLYIKETAPSSYNFIHLTVQEYLAAVHLSELRSDLQTGRIERFWGRTHLGFGHYSLVFRFLSGLTKMVHFPPLITDQMLKSTDKLSLFNWLYEAQDNKTTARTLRQEEMVVRSHYSWTPLDYYVTGYCISHSHCPWSLEFKWSSFDDEKMEMLFRGCFIAQDPTYTGYISRANFSHCILTSKGIEHFTQLPQHILQGTRKLELYSNELDGKACNLLATIIPTMKRLEVLSLNDNNLLSSGAVELIKALHGHTQLKVVGLRNTNIGEEDCECLSELLASSQSLTTLSVDDNHLSPVSVCHIISGLSHNSSLTYLGMSRSEFSEDTTLNISTVLRNKQGCKLKELVLVDCSITASGACHLANGLHTNSTLKVLRLKNNDSIGVGGASAFAAMLPVNTSLEDLDLSECGIGAEGALDLATALHTNSALKGLWLANNPIGVDGASAFAAMLLVNTSLERLDLSDDSIGEEGVQQLIRSLDCNKTLKLLGLPEKYKQKPVNGIVWW